MEKDHTNINQKKTGADVLISGRTNFTARKIIRDREALRNDKGINSPRSLNNP